MQLMLPLKLLKTLDFFGHILVYNFHQQLFLSGNIHNYFKLNTEREREVAIEMGWMAKLIKTMTFQLLVLEWHALYY